jgi:hypothetical protein
MSSRSSTRRNNEASQAEDVADTGCSYSPYKQRNRTKRSNKPGNVLSCFEVNGVDDAGNQWLNETVNPCSKCDNFRHNHRMKKSLMGKTQGQVGRTYHCDTLWHKRPMPVRAGKLTNDHVNDQSEKTPPKTGLTNVMPAPETEEPSSCTVQRNKRKKPYNSSKSHAMSSDALLSVLHGSSGDDEDNPHRKVRLNRHSGALSHEIETLTADLEKKKVENQKLKAELKAEYNEKQKVIKEMSRALKQYRYLVNDNTKIANAIEMLMKTRNPKTWSTTQADQLTFAIFEDKMLQGKASVKVCDNVLADVKKTCPLRDPASVAKAMDLAGGTLNHEGLHVLRRVRTPGCTTGWLASHRQVTKVMSKVEEQAEKIIPYKLVDTPGMDGIEYDYLKMLRFALKIYDLEKIAVEEGGVALACTLDGADISANVTHVTAGLKILDHRAIDPVTKLPIGIGKAVSVQSRDVCVPFKIILAKDSKKLYEEQFKEFFEFFRKIGSKDSFGYKAFNIASPQDMSSFWKCLKKGGACKRKTAFCHCCSCESSEICMPRKSKCEDCTRQGKDQPCYHWAVGDNVTLARVRTQLDELRNDPKYKPLIDKTDSSELLTHWDPDQIDSELDMSNIDYEPKSNGDFHKFLNGFIKPDLRALDISCMGTPQQLQDRLKEVLEFLAEKKELEKTEESANYPGALITIRQAIPCILHCENRVGEKIIKMLLIEGLNARDSNTKEQDTMMWDFEQKVNTSVLGSATRRCNWGIVRAKDSNQQRAIGDQSMPNPHVRKFVAKIEELTAICIKDEERRKAWDACISVYREMMQVARKHDDFSDEEIDQFQNLADDFFLGWITLHQGDGVTNYVHMLGSGHFRYYLQEWRNLYRYSQQGWESLNALIKLFYFRRTQRGGHGGKKDEPNSKIKPIARWISRRLFWLSGQPINV